MIDTDELKQPVEFCKLLQLISRFANSMDAKDWNELSNCLADTLYTDYSDLRRTCPAIVTKEHFISLRKNALEKLNTQHLYGNLEYRISDNFTHVRVSMIIYRRSSTNSIFNTHCLYNFGIIRINSDFRINSIVQKVLWNFGEEEIHSGILN